MAHTRPTKHENDPTRVDAVPSDRPLGSTASENGVIRCSFCERTHEQAMWFVAGPPPANALICSSCVAWCVYICLTKTTNEYVSGKVLKTYVYRIQEVTLAEPQSADAVDPVPASSVEPSTREKASDGD